MSFTRTPKPSSFPQLSSTNAKTAGLGLEFIATVHNAYDRLPEFPASGTPFGRRIRRLLVPKFPYGLLYRAEPERIYIIAVMHLHRRPGYWRSRL